MFCGRLFFHKEKTLYHRLSEDRRLGREIREAGDSYEMRRTDKNESTIRNVASHEHRAFLQLDLCVGRVREWLYCVILFFQFVNDVECHVS